MQLHLQEIIPQRSICLVYDHHRPLNTAARKFPADADQVRPPRARNTDNRRAFPCKLIYTGLLQNSSLKNNAQKPEPFHSQKRLKRLRLFDFVLFLCASCYRIFILQQSPVLFLLFLDLFAGEVFNGDFVKLHGP